ncbi:MAG: flagellar hook protein FlgE [Vulcanimicrobiaceae bacterium]
MAFDSLFTGISGLNAYQSQIDLISNNIANANTTGFKGQRMTFADMFYQTQGAASAPTQQRGGINPQDLGLGVKVNTVDTNFQQGGLETTGINTDLALNGDGFFVLRNTDGSGTPIYTRDGAFSLNSNGIMYDPATGLAVQGYMANSNGQITATGNPGTIQIPIGLSEQAAATGGPNAVKYGPNNDKNFDIQMGGNLDQTQWAKEEQGVAAGTPGTGASTLVSTTIYDSLGNAHQMYLKYVPDATGATAGAAGPPPVPASNGLPPTVNDANGNPTTPATRWKVEAYFADGTQINGAAATAAAPATLGYAFFDQNGQYINTSSVVAGTTVHTAGQAPSIAAGDQINITAWGPGNGNAATAPTGAVGPPVTGPIGLDQSGMGSLAASQSATVVNQNGYGAGILSNITVGQDGTVTGSFTNGQQKALAQVALATFQNEQGLHRVGGNGFVETSNSGLAQYGTAASGRFGSIVADSLEQSNVSLADEFTKMIVAQRAFEANSRTISTADQNLQTAINIRASEN